MAANVFLSTENGVTSIQKKMTFSALDTYSQIPLSQWKARLHMFCCLQGCVSPVSHKRIHHNWASTVLLPPRILVSSQAVPLAHQCLVVVSNRAAAMMAWSRGWLQGMLDGLRVACRPQVGHSYSSPFQTVWYFNKCVCVPQSTWDGATKTVLEMWAALLHDAAVSSHQSLRSHVCTALITGLGEKQRGFVC